MQKSIYTLFLFLVVSFSWAQTNPVRQAYIEKYKVTAVEKMLEHGIPASITLAQGILESGAGKSSLATEANNHFGIKCHKDWTGDTYIMDDDKRNECFRKYKTASESFEDHSKFLTTRGRYAFLFEYKVTDYKKWAHGLKKAGYATNPKYAHLLIKVIEDNQLYKYDRIKSLKELGVKEKSYTHSEESSLNYAPSPNAKPVAVSDSRRLIYENQGVRYVLAIKGDDYYKIAKEFNIYSWQVRKYNDANKKTRVNTGEYIYLEKKNKKARIKYHIVQHQETLRDICQRYAVRMSAIRKLNGMKKNETLREGARLKMQ